MVNKKSLIELFESQVENSDYDEKFFEKTQGERVSGYWPCIFFDGDLIEKKQYDGENYYYKSTHSNNCEMCIFCIKDNYYISFNSIEVRITFSEFKHLKKIYSKCKKEQLERNWILKEKADKKLLDKVFSIKTEKEKRVILFEKFPRKKLKEQNPGNYPELAVYD